jgi:hypothetical protein
MLQKDKPDRHNAMRMKVKIEAKSSFPLHLLFSLGLCNAAQSTAFPNAATKTVTDTDGKDFFELEAEWFVSRLRSDGLSETMKKGFGREDLGSGHWCGCGRRYWGG